MSSKYTGEQEEKVWKEGRGDVHNLIEMVLDARAERDALKAQVAQLEAHFEGLSDEELDAARLKRERFQAAVAAMQGIMANNDISGNPPAYAEMSVKAADALLDALK